MTTEQMETAKENLHEFAKAFDAFMCKAVTGLANAFNALGYAAMDCMLQFKADVLHSALMLRLASLYRRSPSRRLWNEMLRIGKKMFGSFAEARRRLRKALKP